MVPGSCKGVFPCGARGCSVARGRVLGSSTLCCFGGSSRSRASTNSPSCLLFLACGVELSSSLVSLSVSGGGGGKSSATAGWSSSCGSLSSSSERSMDHMDLRGVKAYLVGCCVCWYEPGCCTPNHFCRGCKARVPSRSPNWVSVPLGVRCRMAVDGSLVMRAAFSFRRVPGRPRPLRNGSF